MSPAVPRSPDRATDCDQAAMVLQDVSRHFAPDVRAVDGMSLAIPLGQFVALLGPSGCGKSTTLRLLAGLERPDTGAIWLAGRCVAGPQTWLPPEARRVGLVFQDYALFPHLNVGDNVAFALTRQSRAQRRQRVAELLDLVGLAGLAQRYPHELSGGQQQRVALARALAPRPAVVLLDEPFSNLDTALRTSTREEVRAILRAAGTTALLVTHDQEEALSLADTVAVMFAGRLAHVASPQAVYLQPATRQVATFVGAATEIPGTVHGDYATCALGVLPLAAPVRGAVDILLRPEALTVQPDPQGTARVVAVRFFGAYQQGQVRLSDGSTLVAHLPPQQALAVDTPVSVSVTGSVMAYLV